MKSSNSSERRLRLCRSRPTGGFIRAALASPASCTAAVAPPCRTAWTRTCWRTRWDHSPVTDPATCGSVISRQATEHRPCWSSIRTNFNSGCWWGTVKSSRNSTRHTALHGTLCHCFLCAYRRTTGTSSSVTWSPRSEKEDSDSLAEVMEHVKAANGVYSH